MSEREVELLCLRRPMSTRRTTDYSPPRPPSIIRSTLSVPLVCTHFSIQVFEMESEKASQARETNSNIRINSVDLVKQLDFGDVPRV